MFTLWRDWSGLISLTRRVRVERPNVPEFLITPFGPNGGGKVLNYDIIEFPEEGNTILSNQREFPSLKSGRGLMAPESRRLYN